MVQGSYFVPVQLRPVGQEPVSYTHLDVYKRQALLGIKNRQPFDECFLMAVATVGAFALGDYVEGDVYKRQV